MRRRVGEQTADDPLAHDFFSRTELPLDRQALVMAAFEALPDGIVVLGRDGAMIEANAVAKAILRGLAQGKPVTPSLAPRPEIDAAVARALAGQTTHLRCSPHDDRSTLLDLTISPLAAARSGTLLTLRKLPQQGASETLEAVGRLAGGVAHDFNNILTVVIGNSELLSERLAGDEDGQRLAEISLSAARAGADLTRMLLAYSRQQTLQPSEFCPADLLAEMRGLLERSLGSGIALELRWDTPPWGVRADRAQLASVLLNLALNARDAMPRGGTLTVAVRHLTTSAEHVAITVSDTGTGIPPAVLARVFEPFFTTKEPGKGSGLGLAMVQGFARQSGGHVEIESNPGAGTAVHLHLPRAQVQLRLPEMERAIADLRARAGEIVLVVDDNPAIRSLVAAQLQTLGYGVITASGGRAALLALRQAERVDLLLSDVVMPGIDGLTLARRARRMRPNIRIVLTTAHADQTLDQSSRNPLFGPLLAKPFAREQLARRVRATIDGKLS